MPKTYSFTVDAALLQELGERLIGRPYIALAELIKNSFDADARNCRITFDDDAIQVTDDGHGMTEREFARYWMRVGSPHKVEQATSREFHRPLTGSKGLGRLAVQFLADRLTIRTTAKGHSRTLVARVDWNQIARHHELREVKVRTDQIDERPSYPAGGTHGFQVTMRGLKHGWRTEDLEELGREVWSLRSPFRRFGSGSRRHGEDFDVRVQSQVIENAREVFDRILDRVLNDWKARIVGEVRNGRRGRPANLSVEFKAGYGLDSAETFREEIRLPILEANEESNADGLLDKLDFDVRIYEPEGRQSSGATVTSVRDYLARFGNVNVYDNGFRLPYFGAEHDWLSIAVEQQRRLNVSPLLPSEISSSAKRYMLDLPAVSRIFGVVEISTKHEYDAARSAGAATGAWLTIQAGRDRLHDNAAYEQLRRLLRWALHYYANRYRSRVLRQAERLSPEEKPSDIQSGALSVLKTYEHDIPRPVFLEVRTHLRAARKAMVATETVYASRGALLAPLASAGMAALAASHEMARQRSSLSDIVSRLKALALGKRLPELSQIAGELDDVRRRQDALRRLFAPLVTAEERATDRRLKVLPIAESTAEAMSPLMPGVAFRFDDLPDDLRFPRGAYIEWSALLQNAFANAWNAMLDARRLRISVSGGSERGAEYLRVSDTGRGLEVTLEESQRFFEPFERGRDIPEAKISIALGGQGLGLTIVRMIAVQRHAEVRFVPPEPGYSTTLELRWRSR